MLIPKQLQVAHAVIATLDRDDVVRQLQNCPARFPIDFTPEWIDRQSLAELRHIFAAVCQQSGHMPEAPARHAGKVSRAGHVAKPGKPNVTATVAA